MSKFLAGQKLWKVVRERDDYFYEIKLAGIVIDRIKIEEPTLSFLEQEGAI